MDHNSAFTRKSGLDGGGQAIKAHSLLGVVHPTYQPSNFNTSLSTGDSYMSNRVMPTQTSWSSQPDNTVCVAVDIERVLSQEEVRLVQTVASTLDSSIEIVTRNRDNGMKVIIVYDSMVVACALQSIRILIQGLSTIYPSTLRMDSISAPSASFQPIMISPTVPKSKETTLVIKDQQLNIVSTSCNESSISTTPTEPITVEDEDSNEIPGVFERPLSLKGQRHVFLYKCRYSQLKAIIDRCGCWGLRMASLEEKWPCLVVYCAKDRETWMNAFRKIQKLDRNDFLRKKVADSLQTVDLKKLEDLSTTYGHNNACISLCVQSPSSPSNPSVSVCGVEPFVEQLYKIFVEYHLVLDDYETTTQTTTAVNSINEIPSQQVYPSMSLYPSSIYSNYQNDIFFPISNHPLFTPFSSSIYSNRQGIVNDIPDNYNTTFNNPHLDNFPYSHLNHTPTHTPTKPLVLGDRSYRFADRMLDDQFYLDNEHYFSNDSHIGTTFDGLINNYDGLQTEQPFRQMSSVVHDNNSVSSHHSSTSGIIEPEYQSPHLNHSLASPTSTPLHETTRFSSSGFKEFVPSSIQENSTQKKKEEKEEKKDENETPIIEPSLTISRLRYRDDNFGMFIDVEPINNGTVDVLTSKLTMKNNWQDDGWY